MALEAKVAGAEKNVGSTQFDGLVKSISEVVGRIDATKTTDPSADCALLEAKLELFKGQANALTATYELGSVDRTAVAPAGIEQSVPTQSPPHMGP